nr:hypothetical protein [uncultured Lichenicoccus sp.]
MRAFTTAVTAILVLFIGRDQPTIPLTFKIFGIGAYSCGFWMNTPTRYDEGKVWIYGDWTMSNWRDHLVGHTTDGRGVLAAVASECMAHPSEKLVYATSAAYVRMQDEHR